MTIRRAMIENVKSSLGQLADRQELISFVQSMQNSDGGFCGASGQSDLYYTMFASEIILAAGESSFQYDLEGFVRGNRPPFEDLIHLSAWIRLCADFAPGLLKGHREMLLDELNRFHCEDGGFSIYSQVDVSNLYGCFLAVSAFQDLELTCPDPEKLLAFVDSLRLEDGSFVNHSQIPIGSVPATAAGIMIHFYRDRGVDEKSTCWLLGQFQSCGGCRAAPVSPEPDLLSTAVALFALRRVEWGLDEVREVNVKYIHSLREPGRGFYSDGRKTQMDAEYTYYGLLGLGSLS